MCTAAPAASRRPCRTTRRRSAPDGRSAGRRRAAPTCPRRWRERAERVAHGVLDDRLRREVEHGVDLVLGQHALDQAAVLDVAAHAHAPLEVAGGDERRVGHLVADDHDHPRAARQQRARQPRAEETGGAGHEHRSIDPEAVRHHCLIGAWHRILDAYPYHSQVISARLPIRACVKVVVLCGGQGTRMREETEFRPKPMVEIGGRPILWHIMKLLRRARPQRLRALPRLPRRDDQGVLPRLPRARAPTSRVDLAGGDVELPPRSRRGLARHARRHRRSTPMTGARVQAGRAATSTTTTCSASPTATAWPTSTSTRWSRSTAAHGRLATVTGVHPPSRFGQLVGDGPRVATFAEKPRARATRDQRRLLRASSAPSSTGSRPIRPDPRARAARGAGARRRADGLRARRLLAVRRHRARRRRAAARCGRPAARRGCPVPPRSGGRPEMLAYGVCIGSRERYEALAAPHLRDLGGVVIEADDQRSICSAYNAILDAVADEPDIEGLVLLHEDVTIESAAFIAADPHRARRPRRRRRRSHRRAAPVQPALVAGRGTRPRPRLDRAGRLRRRPARRRRAGRPLPRAVAVGDPAPALRRVGVRRLPRLRLRHLPPGPRRRQARARHRAADHAPHARRLRRRGRLRPRQRRIRSEVARPACSHCRAPARRRLRPAAPAAGSSRRCPPPTASRSPRAPAAAAA